MRRFSFFKHSWHETCFLQMNNCWRNSSALEFPLEPSKVYDDGCGFWWVPKGVKFNFSGNFSVWNASKLFVVKSSVIILHNIKMNFFESSSLEKCFLGAMQSYGSASFSNCPIFQTTPISVWSICLEKLACLYVFP